MLNFSTYEMFILAFFGLFVFLYYLSKSRLREFEKTGVRYLQPAPIFGNLFWSLAGREHLSTVIKKVYDSFPNERYVALFEFMNPTVLLKDHKLIKSVTIKDFEHFHDTPFQIDEDIDPVFGRALVSLKGSKWRHMRSAISPVFTSAKIKNMFNFMMDCAAKSVSFYDEKAKESSKVYEVDIMDLASRFTVDVMASTSFGFNVDSLTSPNNKFFTEAINITKTTIWLMFRFTGFRLFPKFMKALQIRLMPESAVSYFRNLMHDTLREREHSNFHRIDMIHLLLEAKKGNLDHGAEEETLTQFASSEEFSIKAKSSKIEFTDDDLIAQAIIFIVAGQQTTSTVFSFLMHELTVNPDIQERLSEEVEEVIASTDGKLTYSALLQMKYMDMVVSECLRKWSPVPFNTRLCVRDYDLGPVREGSTDHIEVKKGEIIWIPVHSIHMDPLLWPNPELFDPERFSEDNRKSIDPQSYIPFGSGPRNCIGSRFALLNLKVLVFHYISKFKFEPCSETFIPMRISLNSLFMEPKNGCWIGLKPRNAESTL